MIIIIFQRSISVEYITRSSAEAKLVRKIVFGEVEDISLEPLIIISKGFFISHFVIANKNNYLQIKFGQSDESLKSFDDDSEIFCK